MNASKMVLWYYMVCFGFSLGGFAWEHSIGWVFAACGWICAALQVSARIKEGVA